MKRSKTDTEEFILINHMYYTRLELAEELGISAPTVTLYCAKLGVNPITAREQAIDFIKAHATWEPEKLAKHLDMNPEYVKAIMKEHGLYKKKMPLFDSIDQRTESESMTIAQYDKRVRELKARRKSIPTTLSQTHSPYGLADQLRGVEATKDPQTFYAEIVRL